MSILHDFNIWTGEFESFDFTRKNICYGKGSSGSGTNTVTNQSQPPQAVMNAYNQALSSAQTASSAPLQQYQGPLVAGFTPDQTSAFNTVDQLQGVSQPYINQAQGLIQQGTQPLWNGVQQFSPSAVQQYQSPYTQQVLNSQIGLEQNQDAQQQSALKGNAISQGAWGGDRAGVASAVLAGQQDLANNSTNAGILNQGYSQGLNEFNTQQQAQLGANEANSYLDQQGAYGLGNLGQEALSTGLTGATAQAQAGALQQQQGQSILNVPYEQFQQQQAYPFQTAQYYSNIAEGLGSGAGGTSSTTSPAASTAGQNIGLGLGGIGLLGDLGLFNKGGGVKGYGFVPRYDNGGGIQDVSVSYVPTTQSMSGHSSIPSAPKPYQAPNQNTQASANMGAIGNILKSIGGAGGSGLQNMGGPSAMDPGFSNAVDMGGETNPLDMTSFAEDAPWKRGGGIHHPARYSGGGDVLPDILSAVGDIAGSFYGDPGAGNQGVGFLNMITNGGVGKPKFDDGGTVGGVSPLMASSAVQNPVQQNASSQYQNMNPMQLQQTIMRLPPGSQQARVAAAILQQKRMMPNVGAQAQGGFSSPQGYDDGGLIPPPPSPLDREVQDDVNDESGGNGLAPESVALPAPAYGSTTTPQAPQSKADPWLSLATAGFGMAASNNPRAAGAAGEGALLGIKNYGEQKKEAEAENYQTGELANRNKQVEQQGQYQTGELSVRKEEAEARAKQMAAEADRWNAMLKQNQEKIDQGHYVMSPTGMLVDSKTGEVKMPTSQGSTGSSSAMAPVVSGFAPSDVMFNPVKLKAATQADEQDIKSSNQNETIGNNILGTLDHMEQINNSDPTLWGSGGDARTMLHKFEAFTGIGGDKEKKKADLMNGLDKNSNDLATDWQKFEYVPGGRGSVLALKTILASKPGVGQTANVNSDIINELRGKVWDMKLGNEIANTYRSAQNSPGVADGNVNNLEDTLRTLYPTTSTDSKTGRTIFNPENVAAFKEAIPDAIRNPTKYITMAKQRSAASLQPNAAPPQQQAAPSSGGSGPTPSDIAYLRANPGMAAKFEARFGRGSANQVLGGQ